MQGGYTLTVFYQKNISSCESYKIQTLRTHSTHHTCCAEVNVQHNKAPMDHSNPVRLREQHADTNRVSEVQQIKQRERAREGEESSLHLQRGSQETWLLAGAEGDSCVWCGIFKRINAAPIPAPRLTYF